MNEQLQEALRLVHAGRRALWLAGAMQERRDLSAAHDPFFDDVVHAPIRVRYAAPRRAARRLQPSALAECRKINSRRRIPSCRAIAGSKVHRDVLVAIRNP
jgi:hypothetical protein